MSGARPHRLSGAVLAGANTRGDRVEHDYYPTKCDAVTGAFIEAEGDRLRELGGRLCEPAAGEGHMVLPLRAAGFDVVASDLIDRGFPGCHTRSFYDWQPLCWGRRLLVTNPPFCECNADTGLRWLKHAIAIGVPYMALMLPIQWDAPADRHIFFRDRWRPARKRVLTFRPDWTGNGKPTNYVAWYIWDGPRAPNQPIELTFHGAPEGMSLDLTHHLHGVDCNPQLGFDDLLGAA